MHFMLTKKTITGLLVLTLVCLPAFAVFIDQGNAADNNNEGLSLAEAGKLKRALKYFKLAAQQDPNNPQYFNNAGVAQMRLGKYEVAKASFENALRLQPGHEDATANLKELKQSSPSLFIETATATVPSALPRQPWRNLNRNQRRSIRRIHVDDLFDVENIQYLEGKHPMIVTGVFEKWNISQNLFTLTSLKAMFPEATVDFYPHNMPRSNVRPYLVPMKDALREMENPTSAFPRDPDFPGTYLQWNMDLQDWRTFRRYMKTIPEMFRFDDIWMRECMPTDEIRNEYSKRTHWRMMLIGNEGAGMFNHQDVLRTASWQVQLQGAKLWHICAPDQSFALYEAGDVDVWQPDYHRFPRFAQADCFEDTVHQGEFIYYPADYWHQTRNLFTPSISLTGTMADQNNWQLITAELKQQCSHNKWRWNFSKELCAALEKCYEFWNTRFVKEARFASDLVEDLI